MSLILLLKPSVGRSYSDGECSVQSTQTHDLMSLRDDSEALERSLWPARSASTGPHGLAFHMCDRTMISNPVSNRASHAASGTDDAIRDGQAILPHRADPW